MNPPNVPGYHFTDEMTDQAIGWMKAQQSMTPNKPFYSYFATGAVHSPHHVPKDWADKYKGQFDKGFDQILAKTVGIQYKMAVMPEFTHLADRLDNLVAWERLPA